MKTRTVFRDAVMLANFHQVKPILRPSAGQPRPRSRPLLAQLAELRKDALDHHIALSEHVAECRGDEHEDNALVCVRHQLVSLTAPSELDFAWPRSHSFWQRTRGMPGASPELF